jgi:hypothetical protein
MFSSGYGALVWTRIQPPDQLDQLSGQCIRRFRLLPPICLEMYLAFRVKSAEICLERYLHRHNPGSSDYLRLVTSPVWTASARETTVTDLACKLILILQRGHSILPVLQYLATGAMRLEIMIVGPCNIVMKASVLLRIPTSSY